MANHVVHGLCFLTTERDYPSDQWLNAQERKPKSDAMWFTAYLISGGAINFDVKNDIVPGTELRFITPEDIQHAVDISKIKFNPAIESIQNLPTVKKYVLVPYIVDQNEPSKPYESLVELIGDNMGDTPKINQLFEEIFDGIDETPTISSKSGWSDIEASADGCYLFFTCVK